MGTRGIGLWLCVVLACALCARAAEEKAPATPKAPKAAKAKKGLDWAGAAAKAPAIEKAAPEKATAKPLKPRKMLVFCLCSGFAHGSIPMGAEAMKVLGRKTGAYEAVVTTDTAYFTPEKLQQFDAVCLNNCTGDPLPDEAQRKALVDFVKSGKGLVGIHAATDAFYKWPEFGEMMGAFFNKHPWGAGETVGVKIDEPNHPLNAAFKGQGFMVKDEIYQFKEPYSRDKLRVLLSIDTAKTDMNKPAIARTDGDFAITWIHNYGQGRVFYCSFGHNNDIFTTPAILRHYLDGIQFAMGDLPADATPVKPGIKDGLIP